MSILVLSSSSQLTSVPFAQSQKLSVVQIRFLIYRKIYVSYICSHTYFFKKQQSGRRSAGPRARCAEGGADRVPRLLLRGLAGLRCDPWGGTVGDPMTLSV